MTDEVGDAVVTEAHERVLIVTINRPEVKNAIDSSVSVGLREAFAVLDDAPVLAAGVLTGAGSAFCSGMDLKAFARSGPPRGIDRLLATGSRKPLVAAVEESALGGGLELALMCDLIVAAENSRFGLPEVRVGLFAAGGGLARLPQRVMHALAMEMALTGEPVSAARAHEAGLLARVTAPGGALAAAVDLAHRIGANAPLAVTATKRLIDAGLSCSTSEFLEQQRAAAAEVFSSADAREGARAFAERRAPEWTGR